MDGNASAWVVSIMMQFNLINWMHDPINLIGCKIAHTETAQQIMFIKYKYIHGIMKVDTNIYMLEKVKIQVNTSR